MNLAVRPATLPLWLPIWLVALLLLANLALLRQAPQDVTVAHAVEHYGRGESCELTLERQDRRYITRRTDFQLCKSLHRGQPLVLTQTLWLDRWVRLEDAAGERLAILSDNGILKDIFYILMAIALPLAFTFKEVRQRTRYLHTFLAFEIMGCIYFVIRLIG